MNSVALATVWTPHWQPILNELLQEHTLGELKGVFKLCLLRASKQGHAVPNCSTGRAQCVYVKLSFGRVGGWRFMWVLALGLFSLSWFVDVAKVHLI